MSTEIKLEFGLQPPPGVAIAWGARAILDKVPSYSKKKNKRTGKFEQVRNGGYAYAPSLLWDRQNLVGGTEEERKALAEFVNKKGFPKLTKLCVDQFITPDCDQTIAIDLDGYHVEANPRNSCGYLYIVCYPTAKVG